jgi:histidine ammonia-lyase
VRSAHNTIRKDRRTIYHKNKKQIKHDTNKQYQAWQAVKQGRQIVEDVMERKEVAYGINTGFGNFANVVIPEDKLSELQENLIRSHAAGVGDLLSPQRVRML